MYLDWNKITWLNWSIPSWDITSSFNKQTDIWKYHWQSDNAFNWSISNLITVNKILSDDEIKQLHILLMNKYIYPNSKYTPANLPKQLLFINWNRNWDTFYDISWNWNDWTQSWWVTNWRIWQINYMWFDAANSQYIKNFEYDISKDRTMII